GKADAGAAYVFKRNGAAWSLQNTLVANDAAPGDAFGCSVAISGDTIVAGALGSDVGGNTNPGSAYVFVNRGSSWAFQVKLTAFDGAPDDNFGCSVAISGDTIVVGAPGDDVSGNTDQGSSYVFTRGGGSWTLQQKLVANDGAPRDGFGSPVAIDGNAIVVGVR